MNWILRYWFSLLGLINFNSILAQTDDLKIKTFALKQIGFEKASFQSMGHVPMFQLLNGVIYEPIDLTGADLFKSTVGFTEVKLPSDIENIDYAYGHLYRNYEAQGLKKEHLTILIKDYYQMKTINKMVVYIDFNADGDFTNDPKPNLQKIGNGKWYLKLDSFGGGYEIQWFPVSQFRKFAQMNDTAMKELIGPRKYLGSHYSLKANRKSVLYGSQNDLNEQISVGLFDKNFNGEYAEDEDLLILSEGDSVFDASNAFELKNLKRANWKGKDYLIKIDKKVSNYQVTFEELLHSRNKVAIGRKIPRVKVLIAPNSNKKSDLSKKLKRRRVSKLLKKSAKVKLIYFWSAINKDFELDSSMLHEVLRNNSTNQNFDAILVNFGGSIRYISGYNSRFSLKNKQAIADSKTIEKLNIKKIPQFLILDNKNRIIYIGSNIQTIQDYINRNQ